jgi:predicted RNase H-like HicB family nuclease
MKYPIIIERSERNFSAYVPDLPGCVATGSTLEEAHQNVQEAIALHVAGMREDGLPIPPPSTVAFAEVA